MSIKAVIVSLTIGFTSSIAVSETLTIRGPQGKYDASHSYYKGLIKLAYEKIDKSVTIKHAPYMVQGRALNELEDGRILDLYWAGTDTSRENALGVVPIPLIKGLLGYRVLITHKDNIPALENISSIQDLENFRLCQGAHWPDTDILLSAGLSVSPNPVYENMFRQTNAKRCDAFPRGINEAQAEINARSHLMPNLKVYKDLIIYYPFPMYFFTNAKNEKLKNDLTKGLELAIDDGSFDNYIKNHKSTKHLFPLKKWRNSRIITIDNPFIPDNIDTKNSRYWIIPPENNGTLISGENVYDN